MATLHVLCAFQVPHGLKQTYFITALDRHLSSLKVFQSMQNSVYWEFFLMCEQVDYTVLQIKKKKKSQFYKMSSPPATSSMEKHAMFLAGKS